MAEFALHGLSLDNQSSNLDKVFVTLHAFSMSENKKNTVWNSEVQSLWQLCLWTMYWRLTCKLYTWKLLATKGHNSPFLSWDVDTNCLNRTVNVWLYHRREVFQNQLCCTTANIDIPEKKLNFKIFNRTQQILKKNRFERKISVDK